MTEESNDLDYYQNYLRKELYDKVKEDSLVFEFIQSGVLDGVWYWDLTSPENEWMSPQFWQTFGYDPQQMQHLAAEWQDIIFQDDLKTANINFNKHLKNPNHPYDQIVRYKHKDGSTVWVRCRGMAIFNELGEAIRMLGAHTDITPIMRKQEELVSHKLAYSQLETDYQKVLYDLAKEKNLTDSLKQEAKLFTAIDPKSNLWHKNHFLTETKKCYLLSNRLKLELNLAAVFIANFYDIKRYYGEHEINNKISQISNIINVTNSSLIASQFDENLILISQAGYSKEAFNTIVDQLKYACEQINWSIVKPELSFFNDSMIPAPLDSTKTDDENFKRYFQTKYTELVQQSIS